jgi:hypothetical protein
VSVGEVGSARLLISRSSRLILWTFTFCSLSLQSQSKVQTKLYREFRKHQSETDNKNFFKQYHALRPVSNHPAVKIIYEDKRKSRPDSPLFSDSTEDGVCVKVDNQNQPRVAPSKFGTQSYPFSIAKSTTLCLIIHLLSTNAL